MTDETTEGVLMGLLLACTTLALVVPYVAATNTLLVGGAVASLVALTAYQLHTRPKEQQVSEGVNSNGCPSCNRVRAHQLGTRTYRCENCGTVYAQVGEANVAIGKDPRVPLEA